MPGPCSGSVRPDSLTEYRFRLAPLLVYEKNSPRKITCKNKMRNFESLFVIYIEVSFVFN